MTMTKDPGPLYANFSEEDGRLIDAFVTGFRSAKTRSNYRANLSAWLRWTAEIGVNVFAVERGHVETYVGHLEQAGYAPNTICQRIATLSSFYRWAVNEGHLAGNPVEGARRPRKPTESAANGLSRHELTDWLDAAERRGGSDYACACLLALNGLRIGELCATSVEDLGESTWHHTLTLRVDHEGPQGRGDRVGPAQCPGGHPGGRRSAIRPFAAQPPRAAYDSLQRRLSCRRAVPRGRGGAADHAAQPPALGDHHRFGRRARAA